MNKGNDAVPAAPAKPGEMITAAAMPAAASVLCVDDESNILSALRRLFRPDGYRLLVAGSGAEGLRLLESTAVDLVISDMRMPEMDGARFLAQVRTRWPDTVRVLLTGHADIATTVEAINQGEIYRYISKPWDDHEVRLIVRHALERKGLEREKARLEALTQRQNEALQALNAGLEAKVRERTAELSRAHDALAAANERLKTSFLTSVKVFSNLTELSEGPRVGHSRRVADLARRIAVKLELEPGVTQEVMLAGLLHDIGKIGMPAELLAKSEAQMNPAELLLFKKHPAKGETALMALDDLRPAARLLRSHHERYDGLGYPAALRAGAIPLGARILAVANDYDALQIGSFGPARLSAADACNFIRKSQGKRYDPQVVEALLALVGEGEIVQAPGALEQAVVADKLKPGMILSRDLLTREGALLLATDYRLDASLVKQIKDYADGEESRVVVYVRSDAPGQ